MATTKTYTPLNVPNIGPASWRNNSLNQIRLSNHVVGRSDQSIQVGKSIDPLPNFRETVAELSNDSARVHFRAVRQVVLALRNSMLNTNEEIKSLTKGKEALEKTHDHIRKDIQTNKDSSKYRQSRPLREREQDGADDLLHAERSHLLALKKALEKELLLVQQHMQVLGKARKQLEDVTKERARVLELMNFSVLSLSYMSTSSSGPMFARPKKTTSADGATGRFARISAMEPRDVYGIDALGPYTAEAEAALQEAQQARFRSVLLRKELYALIDKVNKVQRAALKSVNDGLTQKIAETTSIKQHLQIATGENRHGLNRTQKWYDTSEIAWNYTKGPTMYSDLKVAERFDRPIVNVLQRHPGNTMPEPQEVVKNGDGLLDGLHETSKNLGLLKLAKMRLKEDTRDKDNALKIDSQVVRMRRRRSDHRWTMAPPFAQP